MISSAVARTPAPRYSTGVGAATETTNLFAELFDSVAPRQ
jgi:hypothetical protein